MYCQRCNLHSEEYVDKCPLCDGPMEVDAVRSGVMKTPTIPEKEDHTLDLSQEEGLKLTEEEVEEDTSIGATVALEQEQIVAEAEKEKLQVQEVEEKEEEPLEDQEDRLDTQELIPVTERPSRTKLPLIISGCILVVLIVGILGYFFLLPSEKTAPPTMKKVAVAKKKAVPAKPETAPAKPQVALAKPEPAPTKPQVEPSKPALAPKTPESTKPLTETIPLASKQVAIEKPGTPSVSPLPAASTKGDYSIHVGSFKEKENADYLIGKLQKKGYPVVCNFVTIPGKGDWYRVQVGYYSNVKEAQQVASKLKTEEKVFTLILKR